MEALKFLFGAKSGFREFSDYSSTQTETTESVQTLLSCSMLAL